MQMEELLPLAVYSFALVYIIITSHYPQQGLQPLLIYSSGMPFTIATDSTIKASCLRHWISLMWDHSVYLYHPCISED